MIIQVTYIKLQIQKNTLIIKSNHRYNKNSNNKTHLPYPNLPLTFYNNMGNNQNVTQWDIKFMQNLDDENFGNIDIFKNDQGKYIMMLRRTFMKDQTSHTRDRDKCRNKQKQKDKQKNDMEFYSSSSSGYKDYGFKQILDHMTQDKTGQSQQYITPILHSQTKIQNICVVYEVIDTYCQYFNFTLADMIKYKKQMDKEQLWLCFRWMLRLAIFLKQKDWSLQEGIKLNRIFLTLKGMPTISIHHMLKSTLNDEVLEFQRSFIDEIGMAMLQLACLVTIGELDNGLQLHLRKVQKIDKYLAQILGNILRKPISLNKNPGTNSKKSNKITQRQLLQKIQKLLEQGVVTQSKQIKLNKFRYILPKSQTKIQKNSKQKQNEQKQKEKKLSKQKQKQKFFSKQAKEYPQKIVINSLQGRRNKQNQSLKNSKKRQGFFDPFQNKMHPMHIQTNGLGYNPLHNPMQTPMNKTMSIKNSLLIDQIQTRKKFTQKQKQKLSERKQFIMNIPGSNPTSNMNKTTILSTNNNSNNPSNHNQSHQILGSTKKQNKQNLLGNSIRQVRPSYNRKQSWTRKIINEHLKQSRH